MPLWKTKSGIYAEIDSLDYQDSWRTDGNSTTVLLSIPWSQRETFLKDMLGYHRRSQGSAKIDRSLPEVCPGVNAFTSGPKQYCVSCDLVQITGVNDQTPATGSITGATNATPIVITTAAAHELKDSIFSNVDAIHDTSYASAVKRGTVTISGVGGNTAANGSHAFKVLSSTTFELVGTAGNGAYTAGGTFSSNSYAGQTAWLNFAKAKYRCTFQALPYVIQTNADIVGETDERKRYVYRRRRFISREMKVPGGGFKFYNVVPVTPLAEVGFRVSTEIEYQYTWYAVPADAVQYTYILDYTGHVNQAAWSDENQPAPNAFGAQTLLFKGVEEKAYFDNNGTLLVDLTYLFSYRGGTWNYFPDRNGVLRKIVDVTNGLTLYPDVIDGPTPAAGTRGIISINAAGNVDFSKLFTCF